MTFVVEVSKYIPGEWRIDTRPEKARVYAGTQTGSKDDYIQDSFSRRLWLRAVTDLGYVYAINFMTIFFIKYNYRVMYIMYIIV